MAATTGAPQPPPPPSGNLPSRPPALTDNGLDDLQRCSVCSRDRPNSEFKFGDSKILKTCTRCRANKGAQNRRVRAKATHAPALTDGGLVDSQICTNCGNTKPKADFQSVRGIGTKTCANCRALNAETARHSKAKKISKNKKAPARTDDDLADEPADELVDDPADDPDDDPDDDRVCNKCGKTKPKSDFRSAYGTHRLLKLCAKCRVVASGADRSGNGTPSATGPPPKKRAKLFHDARHETATDIPITASAIDLKPLSSNVDPALLAQSVPTRPDQRQLSFTELEELAVRSFREARPSFEAGKDDEQPELCSHDYYAWSFEKLGEEHGVRGILFGLGNFRSRSLVVNTLQAADARHGILPRPPPTGASRYHSMPIQSMKKVARDKGYNRIHGEANHNAQAYLSYFFSVEDASAAFQDIAFVRGTEDDNNNAADWNEIVRIILKDIEEDLSNATEEDLSSRRETTTHNHGITGLRAHLESLSRTLMQNRFPTRTSAYRLLSGPEALSRSLEPQRVQFRHEYPDLAFDDDRDRPLDSSDFMELLFEDYDYDAPFDSDAHGSPTQRYRDYIQRTIGHLQGVDDALYIREYTMFTAAADFSIQQLAAILQLLWEENMIEAPFGLGTVTGARRRQTDDGRLIDWPARATIHLHGQHGAPELWIYNNAALGADDYSHWEGMDSGGLPARVAQWGMRIGNMELLPRLTLAKTAERTETRAAKLHREAQNARARYTMHCAKFRNMCLDCREDDLKPAECDGSPAKPCSPCKAAGKECRWPDQLLHDLSRLFEAALTVEDGNIDWDRLDSDQREELEQMANGLEVDPEPEEDHFLCIFTARMSSHGGPARLLQIAQALLTTHVQYDNGVLAGVLPPNVLEGQRPGGLGTPMRAYRQVIARWAGTSVPIQLANTLNDPYLIRFVRLMQHTCRPGNPNIPLEIHLVNLGIAGFAVEISRYGDRHSGFFKYILDQDAANGTNIADRIYIVTIVEPHVVDGVAVHALNHPAPSPHWSAYHQKYILKVKLADLIDRWAYWLPTQVQAYVDQAWNATNPQAPQRPVIWPAVWLQPDSTRLDGFLKAMLHELAWRSAWLDATTTPADIEVQARNNNRNRAMF